MNPISYTIVSLAELERLASELANILLPLVENHGLVVGLVGDLGGGKTTFTRALAKALDAREPVSSPTFVLCHEYSARNGIKIEHWDIYRMQEGIPEELLDPTAPKQLRIIEWIDRSAELAAEASLVIRFTLAGETHRELTALINASSPHAAALTRSLPPQ